MLKKLTISGLVFCVLAGGAAATPNLPDGIALYAGGSLQFDSFSSVLGGDTVAGGNVVHNGGTLNVESIFGGGGFDANGAAFQNSNGQWYFNGDITDLGGPGSVLGGPVRSTAGSIDFLNSSQEVFGDVVAAGSIDWQFAFGDVFGNVIAGGTATISAGVSGSVTSGATVNLPTYVPSALPSGRGLAASTNNITLSSFEDIILAPGVYGDLTFDSGNTVTLTAGSYVFNNIINSFSLNELAFDTSGGVIDLYVVNGLELDLVQVVNGESTSTGNPLDAADIFIETAGDFSLNGDLYGTIFAPNGTVTLETFSEVTGRVFGGGSVVLGNADITYVVPEPASLALLTIGGVLALRRRS